MKENKTKHSIRIPEKKQVDLQTLQFGRGSGRNLKTVFPTLCNKHFFSVIISRFGFNG